MSKLVDLTGQKFGRLTVLERDTTHKDRVYWICRCECGTRVSVMAKLLKNGHSQSCGCLRKEKMTKHGLSRTKIYRTWSDMCSRCFDSKRTCYQNYGGRGITVCDEWRNDFQIFFNHISKLEHFGEEGYTIDRIDVNGNYEPGNVRWATTKEQSRNKTTTRFVEVNGENFVLADLAEKANLSTQLLRDRLHSGKSGEELLLTPKPKEHFIDIGGETISITEVARRAHVGRSTIHRRIANGESGEELLRPAQSQNHFININGEQMILADVAKLAGVTRKTIYKRLSLGATPDQLLRKNRINVQLIEIDGEKLTVKEIAERAGVHKSTILGRIKAGSTGADLLQPRIKILTAKERAEVKRLYEAGSRKFGKEPLARLFGVGKRQINSILNEK